MNRAHKGACWWSFKMHSYNRTHGTLNIFEAKSDVIKISAVYPLDFGVRANNAVHPHISFIYLFVE
jgi:hypothetical protein